jgi:outer membrane protein
MDSMKTHRTALALAAFLICLASGAAAQGSFKLGVFDPNKLLTNSKLGQSLQDDLNKFRVGKEAEIKKSGDDLEKRAAQYKAGVASMSDERREEVETELTQLRRDLERSTHDADDELTRRRQKAYKQLSEDVSAILEDYGKKNGYTVILDRSFCAFAAPSVDISDDLVRLLDSRRTTP